MMWRLNKVNLLRKTKTYCIGSMEYGDDNENWRATMADTLEEMGITCFNPYEHPFINNIDEGKQVQLQHLREKGDLNKLQTKMKTIRAYDLSMVDRSDFIIAYIKPNIPTYGTIDELVMAESLNRPVFICVEGGKRKAPLWLYSLTPHKYMYDSMDEILDTLRGIDSGSIVTDSKRWRLLREEYR
jgi:nucleoside 2-deoxyribosyltransferase